ncbi:MAG: hypothetical protein JWN03_3967 [Nocardia sp.]|uniref:hypothetical protein n=1 Tax=Nocardia sp. TaxID=1821 RepID=UPI0026323317|nr:hypothetical protein [Nocardia sp.]MCU1643692.1 hypothetical protein [Nocardia sp.]
MKQTVIVALAAGALVLGLAGCGSGKSTEAGSQSKAAPSSGLVAAPTATPSATAASAPVAVTTAAAPVEPPAAAPSTATAAKKTTAPDGAQTTCGDFRDLDNDTEKQVIGQVLAANPGSKFDGSPNVALGTAKLVCLAPAYASTPVADAIGATK